MLSGGVVTVVAATPHRGTEKTGSTAACLSLRNYLARTTNQTWPLSEALQNAWRRLASTLPRALYGQKPSTNSSYSHKCSSNTCPSGAGKEIIWQQTLAQVAVKSAAPQLGSDRAQTSEPLRKDCQLFAFCRCLQLSLTPPHIRHVQCPLTSSRTHLRD